MYRPRLWEMKDSPIGLEDSPAEKPANPEFLGDGLPVGRKSSTAHAVQAH
jgi:hypothetical protein